MKAECSAWLLCHLYNCVYVRARARVHALCVLSGAFVGVRGVCVGVRVCVRTC